MFYVALYMLNYIYLMIENFVYFLLDVTYISATV